jgi:hypothetical protein
LFTAESAKNAGEVSASLVFSANSAFKASFVAELCLRPQGQLRCPSAILPGLAETTDKADKIKNF